MILREMMLEVMIGVLVMEVDKVADVVTDMESHIVHLFIWGHFHFFKGDDLV